MYRPELHIQSLDNLWKRTHLISVLFCYLLFFLVFNFTQLSQDYFFSAGGGGGTEEGYQSSESVPNEGHKHTTGKL